MGFVTPIDEDNCRVFSGEPESIWLATGCVEFMYATVWKLCTGMCWSRTVVLEGMDPGARSKEFLYQHDTGLARVRRILLEASHNLLLLPNTRARQWRRRSKRQIERPTGQRHEIDIAQ